jgi:HEAT repeat protein
MTSQPRAEGFSTGEILDGGRNVSTDLTGLYERLQATASDELLAAIIDVRRAIPEMSHEQKAEAASALATLFYVDPSDRPDLEPVVQQAMKAVVAMGPELIPHHLDEMRGVDFQAMFRYAQMLAEFGEQAVDSIVATLEGTDDPHTIAGGIYALSKVRDPSRVRALPLILQHCEAEDAELRAGAVRALGKYVEHLPPDALNNAQRCSMFDALTKATTDVQPVIRAKAIRGLGKMARVGVLNKAQTSRVAERVEEILGNRDSEQWDRAFVVRREANEAREYLAG